MIGTNKGRFYQVDNLENSLDIVYKKLGDVQEALKFLEQQLKLGEGSNFNIANSLHNVDIAYEKLGDVRKTIEYYEQILKIKQELESSPLEDIVIQNKNGISERDKKLKELDQIKYYQDHKDLILKCEKLDELPDEMLPKAIERLKERLSDENIHKAYKVNAFITNGDLKSFEFNKDNIDSFIAKYQKKYEEYYRIHEGDPFILKAEILSLLIDRSVILNDLELLDIVFEKYPDPYINILTIVNKLNHSPIYSTLNSNNTELQKKIIQYIADTIPQTDIYEGEIRNVMGTFVPFLSSDLDWSECKQSLFKPLLLPELLSEEFGLLEEPLLLGN